MSKIDDKMQELKLRRLKKWQAVNTAVIDKYENQLNVEFPTDYKDFLLKYSGQVPDREALFPYLESYSGGEHGILSVFYGIMPNSSYDLLEAVDTYKGRIPNNLLPIGSDPGGNQICLSVNGKDHEKVYFWDHEEEKPVPTGDKIDESNLYLVANSFEEFIESLEKHDEDDDDE